MIGRINESNLLKLNHASNKSEFIALYGRRRVGKTFLIRSVFKKKFTFQMTGLANANLKEQLNNFQSALSEYSSIKLNPAKNWMEAFQQIKKCIEKSKEKKKIVFMDELPWLDTPNSGFLKALEHFWNSWASARKDILLIVCGSAASWMVNKLINNKGGLHNRVTQKIKIEPFNLGECEMMVKSKKIKLDQYQIIQLYMVFGGIPFYWEKITKGLSAAQNIENICFSKNGLLRTEFPIIFKSLFSRAERHESIVNALAKKSKGLTRKEILKETKIANGGGISRLLAELEESGFVRKYTPLGKKTRDSLFQLVDFYSHFYLKFIKTHELNNTNYWLKNIDNPKHRAWSGYAYEQVCMHHIEEIKLALGISGIDTNTYSWKSKAIENGVQIDMVIDRRDQVINLCEVKFSINKFEINKKYNAELQNKVGVFKIETNTKKSVFMTMITTFGLVENTYSGNIQNDLKMNILFNS